MGEIDTLRAANQEVFGSHCLQDNIFDGVKFGDKFKTRDGRIAIFYSVCKEDDGYNFIIEPSKASIESDGTEFHFVDKNGHWHRRDDIDSEEDIVEKIE